MEVTKLTLGLYQTNCYIVRKEDIDAIVEPVLMHRVVTNFAAESQGITPRKAVARLAAEV